MRRKSAMLARATTLFFVFYAVFALHLWPEASGQSSSTTQAGSERVRLKHNILVVSSQGPLHAISFSYEFPGRKSVYVTDLGRVSPSGSLTYLTQEPQITFSVSAAGELLEMLDLSEPMRLMGNGTVDLPLASEFPEAARIGFSQNDVPLKVHAVKILNDKFRSGILITVIDGTNTIITTYRSLDGLPETVFGQVAVLLLHVETADMSTPTFRIHFKVRERRTLTRWRNQASDETLQAAESFVDGLLADIQGGESR